MKKIFDIQDLRNGKPVFCTSISFFPTRIEEKSSHILVDITAVEQNSFTNKYDKAGRFWSDSHTCSMDLCTQVLDENGFNITEQYLKDRMINYVTIKNN